VSGQLCRGEGLSYHAKTLTRRHPGPPPSSQKNSVEVFTVGATMCFVVLCNRHWFNIACLPFALTLTLAVPTYP
jgi:hypothetical protein